MTLVSLRDNAMVDKTVIEAGDFTDLFRMMADVLVELDPNDSIVKIEGNSQALLGLNLSVGDSFTPCVYPRDIPIFKALRGKLDRFRKAGPFTLRVINKDKQQKIIEIYAISTRRAGEVFVQLLLRPFDGHITVPRMDHAPAVPVAEEEEGSEAASVAATAADFETLALRLKDYGSSMKVSWLEAMIKISGLDEQDSPISERLVSLYRLMTESMLVAQSAGHDADRAKSTIDSQQALDEALQEGNTKVIPDVVTDDEGLTESEAIKAAAYSWQKAAAGGKSGSVLGAQGDYEKRLQRTKKQLRAFKNIVMQEYFDVALQPIVDIETGQLHHYEALCRFDPTVYQGSPYHFMCFAEEIGVIQEFDLAMTLRVIQLLRQLRRIGYNLSIAVNISGKSITNPLFLRSFFAVIDDCDDLRSALVFELTESSQIDDLEATNDALSRLRNYGHKVCLDDFGAGAAGLQYLRSLKVDYVKIDGVYIRKGIEKAENRSFLKSIADLCNQLGIETVGECVEDDTQRAFLKEIGVSYAQGWFYGKPLPVDEAIKEFEGVTF